MTRYLNLIVAVICATGFGIDYALGILSWWTAAMNVFAIGERAGASPTSSAFTNNLGALRSAGMIDYPEQGKAKAASWLFLED